MSEPLRGCVVYTDGGARGNPGPAGAGWILLSASGETVSAGGRFLGHATNNIAEYQGLICGLTAARAARCDEIEVRSDSELLVRQMTGRYRVKNHGLKPLFTEATRIAAEFKDVRYVHVRREDNKEADRLANEAMDAATDVGDVADAPVEGPQGTLF